MDCICSIDISIIQRLLDSNKEYNQCLADVTSDQLNKAFSDTCLGKNAFVKDNYDGGNCFYKIDCNSKIGVDIPVKISKVEGENASKIMFIGESVLRNHERDYKDDCLLVGTPFAIIGGDKQPESCDIYKMIFKHWLNMNYQIYITDYIKMWKQGNNYLKGKENKNFREKSQELLKEEIDGFDPNYIVSFGKEAEHVINRINKASQIKAEIINLTHPSNNAKVHWKIEMYEEILNVLLNKKKNESDIKNMEGYKVYQNNKDRIVYDENLVFFANQKIARKIEGK